MTKILNICEDDCIIPNNECLSEKSSESVVLCNNYNKCGTDCAHKKLHYHNGCCGIKCYDEVKEKDHKCLSIKRFSSQK